MAFGAHAGVGRAKGFLRRVVAFVAFDALVDDVLRVPRGEADLGPILRNVSGGPGGPLILNRRNHVASEPRNQEPTHEAEQAQNPDDNGSTLHRPPR